jgi:hypothetical protein
MGQIEGCRHSQNPELTLVGCSGTRLERKWWLTRKNVLLLSALEFVLRSVPRPRTVLRVLSVHRSEIA